jgi:hypothetical protein
MGEKGLIQDEATQEEPTTTENKPEDAQPQTTVEKKPNWGLRSNNTAADYNHPGVKATWDPEGGVWRDNNTGKPASGIPFILVESTDGSTQPYIYNLKTREKMYWNEDTKCWTWLIESEEDETHFWSNRQ